MVRICSRKPRDSSPWCDPRYAKPVRDTLFEEYLQTFKDNSRSAPPDLPHSKANFKIKVGEFLWLMHKEVVTPKSDYFRALTEFSWVVSVLIRESSMSLSSDGADKSNRRIALPKQTFLPMILS